MLGGIMGVQSEEVGSSFWFEIELKKVKQERSMDLKTLPYKTLMTISNNEIELWYIRMVAKSWHIKAMSFTTLESFIDDLKLNDRAKNELVIFIDEDLKSSNINQIIELIRNDDSFNMTPLYLMTSDDIDSLQEKQFDGVGKILKPINQFHLYDQLKVFKAVPKKREVILSKLPLSTLHIMLVIEDEIQRGVVEQSLIKHDVKVNCISSCKALYEEMREISFDLVIIGHQQYDLDLLDEVRANELSMAFETTPFIGMKSKNSVLGIQTYFDDSISYPFKENDLISVINKWCFDEDELKLTDYNSDRLLELFEGDESGIDEIIQIAIVDIPKSIEQIKIGDKINDFEVIKNAAHKLKGLCANIGAEVLSEIAFDIEKKIEGENLKSEIDDLELAFNVFLKKVKNNS